MNGQYYQLPQTTDKIAQHSKRRMPGDGQLYRFVEVLTCPIGHCTLTTHEVMLHLLALMLGNPDQHRTSIRVFRSNMEAVATALAKALKAAASTPSCPARPLETVPTQRLPVSEGRRRRSEDKRVPRRTPDASHP